MSARPGSLRLCSALGDVSQGKSWLWERKAVGDEERRLIIEEGIAFIKGASCRRRTQGSYTSP